MWALARASSCSVLRSPLFQSRTHASLIRTLMTRSQGPSRNRDAMYYIVSLGVVAVGVTFAAIPAYRIFCEKTSFGGLTQVRF
ncbi:unnamed protein product [Anisakis simplex]|uniref:Cytochrome c oxidase assembly protein COX11, mitochondrial n=1 Tax=Anisakis simplex TaxID=6269 RepID=A0A0M3JMV2_ANISI|nr:unnamed protein product [Anisakis simplex]